MTDATDKLPGAGAQPGTAAAGPGPQPAQDPADRGSLDDAVQVGRVLGTCEEVPAVALASAVASVFAAWVLSSKGAIDWVFIWLAAQLAVVALGLYTALRCKSDVKRTIPARRWAMAFNGLVTLAGLLWVYVPISLGRIDGLGSVIVIGFLAVIPVFGVMSHRYLAAGAIGLALAFLGTYAVFLVFFSDVPGHLNVATGCIVYALAISVVSLRVQKAGVALLTAQNRSERFIEELQRTKALADAASRAKTEFLANVSHELRTPLTVVLGMTQLLRLTSLDSEQRESVDMIERSGESLLALINQLLDLSRSDTGRMDIAKVDFDVRATAAAIRLQLAQSAQAKGLEFVVHVADSVPERLRGDEMRLRQVLRNLCENAVKFTTSGRVELAVDPASEAVRGDEVALRFRVSDTGIGMDRSTLAGVFEPFFQADGSATRRYSGTGLGLAISQRLVRLMGGTMSVHSEPGKGSVFSFTVVFDRASAAGTARAPEAGGPPSLPRKLSARALLVEDEPVNALVSSSMLGQIVDTVDRVDSGEEALRAVSTRRYDVILMDCVMQGMDGFEATRLIRSLEEAAGVPRSYIIALTASGLPEDEERCLAAGMDAFIRKPYKLDALRDAVVRGVIAGGRVPV